MKTKKKHKLPLDQFINFCLYNKKSGYYMKKNPFGLKGDFVTAPNISRLFSEIISIWIISFWENLGSPKKINLIELGAGNGEMMKIIIESLKNFPIFFNSCNFIIHEISPSLIKLQKTKLIKTKVKWISKINKLKNTPSIFIANEFFDAMAVKQFRKKRELWFEKFVNYQSGETASFSEKKIDIKKIEKKIKLKISQGQKFIEYSEQGISYLREISKYIKRHNGGLLIIDYGYNNKKMKNTLKGFFNHKFANILDNIGSTDITHNINFNLFRKIVKQIGGLKNNLTTQNKFLIRMGIKKRAEIISRNKSFLAKADIYYRLNRLIDEKHMGKIFKVMLVQKKMNKSKLGF